MWWRVVFWNEFEPMQKDGLRIAIDVVCGNAVTKQVIEEADRKAWALLDTELARLHEEKDCDYEKEQFRIVGRFRLGRCWVCGRMRELAQPHACVMS